MCFLAIVFMGGVFSWLGWQWYRVKKAARTVKDAFSWGDIDDYQ